MLTYDIAALIPMEQKYFFILLNEALHNPVGERSFLKARFVQRDTIDKFFKSKFVRHKPMGALVKAALESVFNISFNQSLSALSFDDAISIYVNKDATYHYSAQEFEQILNQIKASVLDEDARLPQECDESALNARRTRAGNRIQEFNDRMMPKPAVSDARLIGMDSEEKKESGDATTAVAPAMKVHDDLAIPALISHSVAASDAGNDFIDFAMGIAALREEPALGGNHDNNNELDAVVDFADFSNQWIRSRQVLINSSDSDDSEEKKEGGAEIDSISSDGGEVSMAAIIDKFAFYNNNNNNWLSANKFVDWRDSDSDDGEERTESDAESDAESDFDDSEVSLAVLMEGYALCNNNHNHNHNNGPKAGENDADCSGNSNYFDGSAAPKISAEQLYDVIQAAAAAYIDYNKKQKAWFYANHSSAGLKRVQELLTACQSIMEHRNAVDMLNGDDSRELARLKCALQVCFHPATFAQPRCNNHSFSAFLMEGTNSQPGLKAYNLAPLNGGCDLLSTEGDYHHNRRDAIQRVLNILPRPTKDARKSMADEVTSAARVAQAPSPRHAGPLAATASTRPMLAVDRPASLWHQWFPKKQSI